MTDKELTQANKIKKEIRELDLFIYSAEHVWTGKIIKKDTMYIFKANAYGALSSAEYNMGTEMKDKVLNVLRERLQELKGQLDSF